MSDLISRSNVVQILKECNLDETLFEKDVFDKIRNLPTAYSVDKVVEDVRCRCYEMGLDESQTEIVVSEIVKHGGVSDDVCEWKYTKEIMDNAEFKVGCNQNALKRGIVPNNFSYHDFKYCPYCGKKIKAVE